jgi:hypothetical protein
MIISQTGKHCIRVSYDKSTITNMLFLSKHDFSGEIGQKANL